MQPLLLTLDEGYLLTATPPDLERRVAPLGPPAPAQPLLLGREVIDEVESESEVAQSCPTLRTPWTVTHQAQEGLEELSHVEGQEGQWGGDTPRPR